ncbi:hypothetical protein HK098_007574 [Nowakowskiella sp. JEL0407]|nr:hypothetical protein HK098_007574 [Nowakowskiella sp. JEL0407]
MDFSEFDFEYDGNFKSATDAELNAKILELEFGKPTTKTEIPSSASPEPATVSVNVEGERIKTEEDNELKFENHETSGLIYADSTSSNNQPEFTDHPLLLSELSSPKISEQLTPSKNPTITQPESSNEPNTLNQNHQISTNSDLNSVILHLSRMDLERNQQAYKEWLEKKKLHNPPRKDSIYSSTVRTDSVGIERSSKKISQNESYRQINQDKHTYSSLRKVISNYTEQQLHALTKEELYELIKRKERNDAEFQKWLDRKKVSNNSHPYVYNSSGFGRDSRKSSNGLKPVHQQKNKQRVEAWMKEKEEKKKFEMELKLKETEEREREELLKKEQSIRAFEEWKKEKKRSHSRYFSSIYPHPQPWITEDEEQQQAEKRAQSPEKKKHHCCCIEEFNKQKKKGSTKAEADQTKKVDKKKNEPSPPMIWSEYSKYATVVPMYVKKYPLLVASGGKRMFEHVVQKQKKKEKEDKRKPWRKK